MWTERLKCDTCSYVFDTYNLYNTIDSKKRGPKAADINRMVHVGLSHTGLGPSGFQRTCLAMGIPPPTITGLQKASNIVCAQLAEENEQDMERIQGEFKQVNAHRGLPEDTPIDVAMDACYKNRPFSTVGKSPFQAGTQMTQVTCELSTSSKKVVAVTYKNKLCHKARLQEQKTGKVVTCPNHPGHCSANIQPDAVIGVSFTK